MPQILVVADTPQASGDVVYRERVATSDLESSHFSGQLLERINWAVGDAQAAERRDQTRRRTAELRRRGGGPGRPSSDLDQGARRTRH